VLAAAQRLRRREDFTAAVRTGRRASRGSLVVHVAVQPAAAGAEPAPPRAGFVVPKAVGGAVVRNLVRRRLRHLVRERLSDLPAGTDLVVRALPGAGDTAYSQLGKDLDEALTAVRRPRC
jgi:ribonuclease P protein component